MDDAGDDLFDVHGLRFCTLDIKVGASVHQHHSPAQILLDPHPHSRPISSEVDGEGEVLFLHDDVMGALAELLEGLPDGHPVVNEHHLEGVDQLLQGFIIGALFLQTLQGVHSGLKSEF